MILNSDKKSVRKTKPSEFFKHSRYLQYSKTRLTQYDKEGFGVGTNIGGTVEPEDPFEDLFVDHQATLSSKALR